MKDRKTLDSLAEFLAALLTLVTLGSLFAAIVVGSLWILDHDYSCPFAWGSYAFVMLGVVSILARAKVHRDSKEAGRA